MNYYNYFTEIEEHFARRRGRHLWISPLDWHLIEMWRNSGIPLHVALRGIDIAMDHYFARQPRTGSRLNSLAYCHDGVMAEYARHLETHQGEEQTEPLPEQAGSRPEAPGERREEPEKGAVLELLNSRIAEMKTLYGKQSSEGAIQGIRRVLLRLEEIARDLETGRHIDLEVLERDLAILDDLLMEMLRPLIAPELFVGWENEAKRELKIYKKRLPKEAYQKIHESFVRRKIHNLFELGELSLFHL